MTSTTSLTDSREEHAEPEADPQTDANLASRGFSLPARCGRSVLDNSRNADYIIAMSDATYPVRLPLSDQERRRLRVLAAQDDMSIAAYLAELVRKAIRRADRNLHPNSAQALNPASE